MSPLRLTPYKSSRCKWGCIRRSSGGGGGAVVNVLTKSGSNAVHGTVFEFLRNNVLDSRNFFSDVVPPHKRNQFGGSVGGPIKKDKLFFFANYEGTRDRAPQTQLSRIPTDLEKAGNLSDLGETLIDPQTGLPFPGAVIPADRIDSISKAVMAYYPEPNVPSDPNINYRYNSPSIENDYTGMGRIDFNISPRHTLMGRYALNNGYRFTGGSYPKVGGEILPQRFQNGALTLTSNLTPQLLNEARFTYDRSVSNGRGKTRGAHLSQT